MQQLGVFSKQEISEELLRLFLKRIPRKFLKIALQFNSQNKFTSHKIIQKNNYILSLNSEYKTLYKNFSKGRKHAIQQGLKHEFDKLIKLVEVLQSKNKVKIIGVKKNKTLIGGSVFIIDNHRIIYLFSAVSKTGKENQVASLLLNNIIETHANTNKILDFEGSMTSSIASFFKSFGASPEAYFLFKKWLL